jgi:hypothetical protein
LEVSRDLGLTREKSARLFRKLSQRNLVLDMVDDYEKKERIRSDKLGPLRANTCGPLPSKYVIIHSIVVILYYMRLYYIILYSGSVFQTLTLSKSISLCYFLQSMRLYILL